MNKIRLNLGHSIGPYAYCDKAQKSYVDLLNHYSSLPLGYNHPVFRSAEYLQEIVNLAGVKVANGLYNTDALRTFWANFCQTNTYCKWHFCNTGSLAVEAAVKTALFHAKVVQNKPLKNQIITIRNNFHGVNSFGNFLSNERLSGDKRFFIDINAGWNIHAELDEAYDEIRTNDNIAGIIIEPIQCTYGDRHLDRDYLTQVILEAKARGIAVIFDEIQTGFGVTGKWWYYEHFLDEYCRPDIVIFGKKAQVSGIMVEKRFCGIFDQYSKLSVTFDGDLSDMIRCKWIIKVILEEKLLDNITQMGEYFLQGLKEIPLFHNVRGIGGLIAFDLADRPTRDIFYEKLFEKGLLCNPTSAKSIRLRPALNIKELEVDLALDIFSQTAKKM